MSSGHSMRLAGRAVSTDVASQVLRKFDLWNKTDTAGLVRHAKLQSAHSQHDYLSEKALEAAAQSLKKDSFSKTLQRDYDRFNRHEFFAVKNSLSTRIGRFVTTHELLSVIRRAGRYGYFNADDIQRAAKLIEATELRGSKKLLRFDSRSVLGKLAQMGIQAPHTPVLQVGAYKLRPGFRVQRLDDIAFDELIKAHPEPVRQALIDARFCADEESSMLSDERRRNVYYKVEKITRDNETYAYRFRLDDGTHFIFDRKGQRLMVKIRPQDLKK